MQVLVNQHNFFTEFCEIYGVVQDRNIEIVHKVGRFNREPVSCALFKKSSFPS